FRSYSVVMLAPDARGDLARLDRDRLINDALLFGVVAHFHVAENREILAERMADEAIVRQDAAQVGMAFEDDAEKVEGFALVPVDRGPDVDQRGNHRKVVVGRV